jgi:SAM-dependent methyltransferase
VLGLLSIREGEHVADLGAGVGFFAGPISAQLGERGILYLVETDPRLLEVLEQSSGGWIFDNTVVVRGGESDPGLPEGELDLVLAVNTWHRLADRRAMREAIQRALKPGGRLAIIDWHLGDVPIAPPVERRLPHDELVAEMKAAGWTVTTDASILEYQYFVIFTPPAR